MPRSGHSGPSIDIAPQILCVAKGVADNKWNCHQHRAQTILNPLLMLTLQHEPPSLHSLHASQTCAWPCSPSVVFALDPDGLLAWMWDR